MSLLGPLWLTQYTTVFGFILGAVVLVIFSDTINRNIVFPVADSVKAWTHKTLGYGKKLSKVIGESLATMVFILFCWLGSWVLARYIFLPILQNVRNILLPVIILLFWLISKIINDKSLRNRLMKF